MFTDCKVKKLNENQKYLHLSKQYQVSCHTIQATQSILYLTLISSKDEFVLPPVVDQIE